MNQRAKTTLFLGLALLALVGCQTAGPKNLAAAPAAQKPVASIATPPGVTLQATRGTRSPAGVVTPGPFAYADPDGKLAYIYDKDSDAGRAACTGPCAANWLPLAAPAAAQPAGAWTVALGEGGQRQWAFKGHPLYVPREVATGPNVLPYKTCVPARDASQPAPAEFCVALFSPSAGLMAPDGVAVRNLANANGVALVDGAGLTLYAFDGDVAGDGQTCLAKPCDRAWTPLVAPALARARGQFSIVKRADGTPQWAFRGRALYTYQGDSAPDDVTGTGVDPRWSVMTLSEFPTPPDVAIRRVAGFGTIWVDGAGMTLYTQNIGGDAPMRRRGPGRIPYAPVKTCEADCRQSWRPLLASAEAQATGFWTITMTVDGKRQWAYRGSPLYTYTGDARPGDLKGNYIYNYLIRDANGQVIKVTVGTGRVTSELPTFWRPAFPY